MSSMLEQAIIDAEQLKETARKTAEENIVEKYQDEIKQAVEKILEQEEASPINALEVDQEGNVEMVEELPAAQIAPTDETVTLDLDKLEELMAEEELDPSDMLQREEVAEELDAITEDNEDIEIELTEELEEDTLDEEIEIDEAAIRAAIAEMLEEDEGALEEDSEELNEDFFSDSDEEEAAEGKQSAVGADDKALEEEEKPDFLDLDKDGDKEEPMKKAAKDKKKAGKRDHRDDMGGGHGDFKIAQEKPNFPFRESKELKKENKSLLREQKKMSNKVQLLENKINKYGTVIEQLKEKLDESNLTNAKLLYQNRILNSVSLNERQKEKIVETISNAKSVEEARIIFETLQSSVGSTKKRKMPESLNEVVSRSSSAFLPRREERAKSDPFADRMKALAGLK